MLADVRFDSFEEGLIVRITGDVDMSNADEIGKAIKQMTGNEALGVVLDLSEVDYFDSAGIHLVYDLRESLRVRGQNLRLVVPEGAGAREALRLAAVLNSLDVDMTVEESVAEILGGAGR